jgi:hypothetical protein
MLPASTAPVLSLETLYAVRLSTFSLLFSSFPPPRDLALPVASHAALEPALVRASLADDTADALALVEAFAHEDGRRALYEAARALDRARAGWRDCTSPADLAAYVVATARTDAATGEVLECARIRIARSFPHRSWYQFVGKEPAQVGEPTQYLARLDAAFARLLDATDRGPWRRVRAFGTLRKLHFEFAHEDRALGGAAASPKLAPSAHRPVRSHLVSFDAASNRLFVWTASPDLVTDLVALVAAELVGDARWFFEMPAVDLSALQAHAEEGKLPVHGGAFARLSLIGMTWDSGAGHSLAPRGADVYAALRRHGVGIAGGAIRHATVRAESAPGARGPRTADLSIRPPYTVTCSEPDVAPAFLREADKLGLTRPGATPRDYWTLAPYVHSREEWLATPDGAALVERGFVAFDDRARRVRHPDHPHAGRVAPVFAIRRRGASYAPPEDPILGAFLVDDDALTLGAIDWPKLGAAIAAELRLDAPARAHPPDDDRIVRLGAIDLGPQRACFLLCTEPCAASTLDRHRRALAPDLAVFVIPEGRALARGFASVGLARLAGPYRPLLAAAVRELGLQAIVPPTLYAPDGARLVIHRDGKQAYLDGVPLVRASDAMVNALLFLADNAGRLVTAREIGAAISAKSDYDARARKTLRALDDAVAESFRLAKKKLAKDARAIVVMDKHGQYRLGVTVFVV